VQVFEEARLDDARRWLRESLGSIHLDFDDAQDALTVRLFGKLEPEAYEGVDADIDAWLAKRDRMRLLLDLREFDGWQGLGALAEHLALVREHRRRAERVAVVGKAAWQRLAARVMSRFVRAEVRYFTPDAFGEASAWVRR
jgi:SpoIIAA-like